MPPSAYAEAEVASFMIRAPANDVSALTALSCIGVARLLLEERCVHRPFFRAFLVVAGLSLGTTSPAHTQPSGATFVCTGQVVSRIDIQPSPPPFSGAARRWRASAHAVGIHHADDGRQRHCGLSLAGPGKGVHRIPPRRIRARAPRTALPLGCDGSRAPRQRGHRVRRGDDDG